MSLRPMSFRPIRDNVPWWYNALCTNFLYHLISKILSYHLISQTVFEIFLFQNIVYWPLVIQPMFSSSFIYIFSLYYQQIDRYSIVPWVGNFDIDFLIFRHHFHIMSLKFPKFDRVWNVAKIFENCERKSAKLWRDLYYKVIYSHN
jgi:hypothetical protein